jgi:hypothetical protein
VHALRFQDPLSVLPAYSGRSSAIVAYKHTSSAIVAPQDGCATVSAIQSITHAKIVPKPCLIRHTDVISHFSPALLVLDLRRFPCPPPTISVCGDRFADARGLVPGPEATDDLRRAGCAASVIVYSTEYSSPITSAIRVLPGIDRTRLAAGHEKGISEKSESASTDSPRGETTSIAWDMSVNDCVETESSLV